MDRSREVTWRRRLDGEQQDTKWKALHQSRGIPAFSSSFFCYSLESVLSFFSPSPQSLPDLGTDKGEEGRGWGEGKESRRLTGNHLFTVPGAALKKKKKKVWDVNVFSWWLWWTTFQPHSIFFPWPSWKRHLWTQSEVIPFVHIMESVQACYIGTCCLYYYSLLKFLWHILLNTNQWQWIWWPEHCNLFQSYSLTALMCIISGYADTLFSNKVLFSHLELVVMPPALYLQDNFALFLYVFLSVSSLCQFRGALLPLILVYDPRLCVQPFGCVEEPNIN